MRHVARSNLLNPRLPSYGGNASGIYEEIIFYFILFYFILFYFILFLFIFFFSRSRFAVDDLLILFTFDAVPYVRYVLHYLAQWPPQRLR
jgi:hypothetical protein